MTVASYVERGFSLIPIAARSKRPTGKWQHAQSERASLADAHLWLAEGSNLAVVTGRVSGVVVVDCDSEAGVVAANRRGMPITPTATTGKGRHYFFTHPGQEVRNAVRLDEDVDLRGDGGYVLVAPSVHPSGAEYRWVPGLGLDDVPLAPCPEWVMEAQAPIGVARDSDQWVEMFEEVISEGGRNHRCAELAGYLLRKWVDVSVATWILQQWNGQRCLPPMPALEVAQVVRSINEREMRRRGNG